jgi:hypothetical protein
VAQMSESVPGRPADTSDVGKPSTAPRQARRRSRSPPGRIRDLAEIAEEGLLHGGDHAGAADFSASAGVRGSRG